jgi:hypothetical protein
MKSAPASQEAGSRGQGEPGADAYACNPSHPARSRSGLLYPSNESVDINRNQAMRGLQTSLMTDCYTR